MEALTQIGQQQLLLFMLVLTRLSLMLMGMPGVGAGVPRRVKVFLVLTMTGLLFPLLGDLPVPPVNSIVDLAIAMGREAIVGLFIGLVIQLLITGIQLAGELISSTAGMQLGAGTDPQTKAAMPILGNMIGMMVTVILMSVGGQHMLIDALFTSFRTIPPGLVRVEIGWIELLTYEMTQGMATGVRAGAPVVTGLLLSNLITGLLSRTLPQLNILAVGLNVNAIAMMAISAIALGSCGLLFETELSALFDRLGDLLATTKPG
ncbi:flagellar biosynthesis protein FliR [Rosistilla carotiformis]|uniref:Flagellar biosynthesis protein FliR n=1 Tax=Rosistilla carotiformis TaxID=2528017 RepID=A0A518K1X6_9BACT|nr:flagellar biosynthetic protein FliR [Rosistilla carotiformis]QDV71777.1 flagellar biosynthesis protein FliR [Rosistilla carotiformis]